MLGYNDRPQHLLDADDVRAEGAGRLARADLPVKVNEALPRKKKGVRLVQNMQVGPRNPVGIQL